MGSGKRRNDPNIWFDLIQANGFWIFLLLMLLITEVASCLS